MQYKIKSGTDTSTSQYEGMLIIFPEIMECVFLKKMIFHSTSTYKYVMMKILTNFWGSILNENFFIISIVYLANSLRFLLFKTVFNMKMFKMFCIWLSINFLYQHQLLLNIRWWYPIRFKKSVADTSSHVLYFFSWSSWPRRVCSVIRTPNPVSMTWWKVPDSSGWFQKEALLLKTRKASRRYSSAAARFTTTLSRNETPRTWARPSLSPAWSRSVMLAKFMCSVNVWLWFDIDRIIGVRTGA